MVELRSLALAAAVAVLAVPHRSSAVELVRLVDSSTLVPGTTEAFFLDSVKPTACDLGVVFQGLKVSDFDFSGLYLATDGGLQTLVDVSTPVPAGVGTFEGLEQPHCENGRVVFGARDSATGKGGVYEWRAGALRRVADGNQTLPGADHPLQGMGDPVVSGSTIGFRGTELITAIDGVYLARRCLKPTSSGFGEARPHPGPDCYASPTSPPGPLSAQAERGAQKRRVGGGETMTRLS